MEYLFEVEAMLKRIEDKIRFVTIKLGNLKGGDTTALNSLLSVKNELHLSQHRITWWNILRYRSKVNKALKLGDVFLQSHLPEDDSCFNNENVRYLLIPFAR